MKDILARPETKEVAIRTGSNVFKLGALAAGAVFAQTLFKTQATATLESAKIDYSTVRNIVRSR